ncbi:MAG: NAD(P)-dependent oxidoreductase [Candidatus Promineifilaceae bacterium]|nr:NAD(P)-dependent oxidoreductase [Candidatus Promineifilaceae bacterium]
MRTKNMWIKDEYLKMILDGRKTVEIRVGYDNIKRLQVGDQLLFNDQRLFTITRISHYRSFEKMLQSEDLERIAPGIPRNQLINQIRAIYPREKEDLGVVALEIDPVRELRVHIQYAYQEDLISHLRSLVNPNVTITVGREGNPDRDYHVLVAGRPERHDIEASAYLSTLIIPWAGLPVETRELLSDHPSVSVHNLHFNAQPVAELAVALLLAAAKSIIPYDNSLRRHDWSMRYKPPHPTPLLGSMTALILGYGQIGRQIAKICSAFDMKILATRNNPMQSSDQYASEIHPPQSLTELLPLANTLIISLPLTPQTDNLIDAPELALLKSGSILVNIGRGKIVNEAALYEALLSGRLYAAGLDVWYNYPPDKASRSDTPASSYPFHELENVVMSPHRAGSSAESDRLRMSHLATLLNAVAEGKPVPNRVDVDSGY